MNVPQATLQYAGVHAEGSFSVVRSGSTGADPIVAKFYLGTNLPPVGDMLLAFGASWIRMRNCRIVKSASTTAAGRMLEVQFEDRRWAWRYKRLYVRWNDRVDGSREYQTSFVQMVSYIVYTLLGEVDADLSILAAYNRTFDYPQVLSDGDLAIDVLEELLEKRGLMVVLDLWDRLVIRRRGVGPFPPADGLVIDQEYSTEPPAIPQLMYLLTAPIRFEKDLLLEPVGLERSGAVRPINDLTYKPANGWEKENPRFFPNVAADSRDLAKQCVWKMYRVVKPSAIPVPQLYPFETNIFTAPEKKSILPLLPVRANGKPAEVIGYYTDTRVTNQNNAVPDARLLDGNGVLRDTAFDDKDRSLGTLATNLYFNDRFDIDTEAGMVVFDRPVYFKQRTGAVIAEESFVPAKIVLRTAFNVRQGNGQFVRHVYTYQPNLPFVIPGLSQTFQDDNFPFSVYPTPQRGTTSRESMEAWGVALSDDIVRQFLVDQNCVTRCAGFRFDRSPDGRMYAVRFDRSEEGQATTQLEWQTELTVERLSYSEKVNRLRVEQRDRQIRQAAAEMAEFRRDRRRGRVQ